MRRFRWVWTVLFVCSAGAWAQSSAPGGFDLPPASKAALEASLNPIPKDTIASYLEGLSPAHVFRSWQGKNQTLAKENAPASKKMRIGINFPVDLPAESLFTDATNDGNYTVYLGAITSVDALGLRLRIDLSGLTEADEAWVIDPTAPRAFGPFRQKWNATGGRWLSSVEGDTAVVMVRTTAAHFPAVRVLGVSHFYVSLAEALKVLSCNVNAACEADAYLRDHVSTAVGRIAISSGSSTSLCSGALVNNPDTPELEPYFITAHHCIGTADEAEESEVIWDYRSSTCATDTVPSLSSLPRSEGETLLATNATLDGTLIELEEVPSGALGRYYLGWELRTPVIDEPIIGVHHPRASAMRINHGRVTAINQRVQSGAFTFYQKQTRVVWDEGVTEAGSSGSCLLFDDGSYALTGMLSNGPVHTCGDDRSGNIDDFASFRDFYSEIAGFLTGDDPPEPIDPSGGMCPAKAAFEGNPEALEKLRALRDQGLLPTAIGKRLTSLYYKSAPYLAELVRKSPEARGVFVLTASPFVSIGGSILQQSRHAAITH